MDMYIWVILGCALGASAVAVLCASMHFRVIEDRLQQARAEDYWRTPGSYVGDILEGYTFWKALMWISGLVAAALWLWFVGSVGFYAYQLESDLNLINRT